MAAEHDGGRRGQKWRIGVWVASTALILLVPFFAMQVTEEVDWSLFDVTFMGALLFGAGATYEWLAGRSGTIAYRAATGVALAAAVLLVLVNGAVGIIGTEDDGANLMYGGVLAVGLIGAVIARFQPDGMARALLATALAQTFVAVIALAAGLGPDGANARLDIVGVTGLFASLWLLSAWLYGQAARATSARRRSLA